MDQQMSPMSSVPQVLVQNNAFDENQDTVLTSIRLEPNNNSQIQTNFVLPKNGSVLDSNSSLVWSIGWAGYDDTNGTAAPADQLVCLKNFSGGLNSIRRARMYVGGRLLFTNPDVGLSVHIHKLATNPDHFEEVEDKKLGSAHGFEVVAEGKVATQPGVTNQSATKRLTRQVGSYSTAPANNLSFECTVLLSDVFPALKHLQIPIKYLKEDLRVEIDWETDFNEVFCMVSAETNAITDFSVTINNPLLYLDYLTYNEEVEAGLLMASQSGITIPYREISLIQKQLPAIAAGVSGSQDILLGFQGKLLMKVYVSHRFNNLTTGNTAAFPSPLQRLNGRCRSDMGQDFKYNLIVNDLHIHDAKVDTASQQYSFLSMTAENPIYAFPNSFDYNSRFTSAIANTDINDGSYRLANGGAQAGAANNGLTAIQARDGIAGSQAFIGFDLSKYGPDGGLNPANAGYRVGSTPMVLNIEQLGGANGTRQGDVKQVDVLCESVKILQIRNGMVDTTEA